MNEIFPPTFLIDIDYEGGTSISVVYSQDQQLLGIIQGTWQVSENTHLGLETVSVIYANDVFSYFSMSSDDMTATDMAIEGFKDLIKSAFD